MFTSWPSAAGLFWIVKQGHSVSTQPEVPAQIFDFANIFSEERQTCIAMKAKVLNVVDEYLLNNPLFCRGGSIWQFSPEIQSQIIGGKNGFRKMAES